MGFNSIPCNPYPISTEELNKENNDDLIARVATLESDVSDLDSAKANKADIATEFSDLTNYYAGDLVYYEGDLYEFQVDHTAGSWETSEVIQKDLSDIINTLKGGLPDYSTTEQETGQKWKDGRMIYMCTTECEIPANQGQGNTHFTTSVSSDASVIDSEIVIEDAENHFTPGGYIPWYSAASTMFAGLDSDGLNVWFGGDHYKGKKMNVTLWYTKVSV